MKLIKICINIILSIILGISLSLLVGILTIRNIINEDNIQKIISNNEETSYIISNTEIAYNESDIETIDYAELESITQDSNRIHELLDQIFISEGLPTGLIDYIINDTEYQSVLSEYLSDFLNYTIGNGEKPIINEEKVNSILEKNIQKYEQENNQTINKETIDNLVTNVSETINEKTDEIASNNTIKPILSIVFSKALLIGLIINCLVITGIIIILNMNVSSITIYLALAILTNSVIYTILSTIISTFKNTSILDNITINNIINLLNNKITSTILISFVIGIVLLIVGIILKSIKKGKQLN